MSESAIKSRFSTSPTGQIHLGYLRTALFGFLLANPVAEDKQKRGEFLLRIEDSEKVSSISAYVDRLMDDFVWLGLDWQEGPKRDKGNGPYFQGKRGEIYEAFYQKLIESKQAYYCFCSEKELLISTRLQMQRGEKPHYEGTCRHLTHEQIEQKLGSGLKPCIRFKTSEHETVSFDDLVLGAKVYQTDDIGDFIIKKNDDTASFMFCNAVDDALMGITYVIRGIDHLDSTPLQLLILQALGLKQPQYGHLALINGHDGNLLSKRNGSQSVAELRDKGFLPIAIVNCLARIGHDYDSNDLMSLQALADNFKVDNIGSAAACYEEPQLLRWQKQAINRMSKEEFWAWLTPELQSAIPKDKQAEFIDSMQDSVINYEDVRKWVDTTC